LRDKPSLRSQMIEWLFWRLPIMTRLQKEHDRLRIFNERAVFAVLDHADHLILRSGPQHETLAYGGLIAEQHAGEGFIDASRVPVLQCGIGSPSGALCMASIRSVLAHRQYFGHSYRSRHDDKSTPGVAITYPLQFLPVQTQFVITDPVLH
jgi:hypothetical protein